MSRQPRQAAPVAHADPLTMASLVQELEKNRKSLASELKTYLSTSLETSLAPIRTSLDTISAALDSHNQKIITMESTLTNHSDELTELTSRLERLEKSNAALASKAEDLENRSRRQNLRIVGLPDGIEGSLPSEFVSQLIQKIIGSEIFPKPPELDRAHRIPAPRPTQGQRPRLRDSIAFRIRNVCFVGPGRTNKTYSSTATGSCSSLT